jgi:hypothetical protein
MGLSDFTDMSGLGISVMCRPGKLLIPSREKESDAAPNRSDRQTTLIRLGKTRSPEVG